MGNDRHIVYGFVAKDSETGEILGWTWVVQPQIETWMLGVWNAENLKAGLNFILQPLATAN